MQKKSILALLLALIMLLTSGCALIYKDEAVDAATEIIRVGDTAYTKAEVNAQVNYQLSYMAYVYSMYGLSYQPTAEQIASTRQSVIDSMVQQAVITEKIKELGLDKLTDEEKAEVEASAEELWNENREYVRTNYFATTELTGDELEAAIDAKTIALGATRELMLEDATTTYTQNKLREYVVKDVTVSADEVTAAYNDYVAVDKGKYAEAPSAFCTAVNNGDTVYYRPAGVRMVKQILVATTEEDEAAIESVNNKLSSAQVAASQAQVSISALNVADVAALTEQVTVTLDAETGDATEIVANFAEEQTEEVAALIKNLAVANAQVEFYTKAVADAQAAALENIAPKADEILQQLADGADWDALMAEKTEDPGMQAGRATAETGYAVCAGYTDFDSVFVDAAMAIPEVGQWSDKVPGSYGYYIIKYVGDAVEGAVELDDALTETLEHDLQHTKEDTTYNNQITAWVSAAKVTLNTKALDD